MPELPDLNSPQFAPIKTRLAKAYLDHKADIGAPHATDQDILDHVDDITALMLGALGRAMFTAAKTCMAPAREAAA
jgi:hypothetical protein